MSVAIRQTSHRRGPLICRLVVFIALLDVFFDAHPTPANAIRRALDPCAGSNPSTTGRQSSEMRPATVTDAGTTSNLVDVIRNRCVRLRQRVTDTADRFVS